MMKKQILFARVERTEQAKFENVYGDWNKKIVFYVTDGKRIIKVGEESYSKAKEIFLRKQIIFVEDDVETKPVTIMQDIGSIKLYRYR